MSTSVDDVFKAIHKVPQEFTFTNKRVHGDHGDIEDPILLEPIRSYDDKKSSILIYYTPIVGTLFKPSGIKRLIHTVLDSQITAPTRDEFYAVLDDKWTLIKNPLTRKSIFSSDEKIRNKQIEYYWEHLYKGTDDDGSTDPRRSTRGKRAGGRRRKTRRKTKRRQTKKRRTKRRRKTRRRRRQKR